MALQRPPLGENEDDDDPSSALEQEKFHALQKTLGYRFRRVEDLPRDLSPEQHVWVCKSKGLNGRRHDLFLRAQVVGEEKQGDDVDLSKRRLRVRYPKGSTYACLASHLLPIWTEELTILVASETKDYRKACVVHTLPEESFLEVGCDYGATVERVYRSALSQEDESPKRKVWGVDKASESVEGARQRYPQLEFFQWDVLACPSEPPFHYRPDVVSLDINGTRELPAVLEGCRILVNQFSPRLIIVKSRALSLCLPPQLKAIQARV